MTHLFLTFYLIDLVVKPDAMEMTLLRLVTIKGAYSQNSLQQIRKTFVTLTWILEPIKHKK